MAFLFSFGLTLVAALVSALGYVKKDETAGFTKLR